MTLGDSSTFESVPEFAPTASVWQRLFADLPYVDVTMNIDINCQTRFNLNLTAGQFRNMSRIWLSKLPLLCEEAETEPDQVTILLDTGVYNRVKQGGSHAVKGWDFALEGLSEQDFETEAVHMQQYPSQVTEGQHTWFGCSDVDPQVCAQFMVIRGRHCPKAVKFYSDALLRASARACNCFDEEVALTDMLSNTDVIQPVHLRRAK